MARDFRLVHNLRCTLGEYLMGLALTVFPPESSERTELAAFMSVWIRRSLARMKAEMAGR